MEEISFNKFKKELTNKKVKYMWYKTDKSGDLEFIKSFETDKFYINNYKGVLSSPSFILGLENKYFKENNKTYYITTDKSKIFYEVI